MRERERERERDDPTLGVQQELHPSRSHSKTKDWWTLVRTWTLVTKQWNEMQILNKNTLNTLCTAESAVHCIWNTNTILFKFFSKCSSLWIFCLFENKGLFGGGPPLCKSMFAKQSCSGRVVRCCVSREITLTVQWTQLSELRFGDYCHQRCFRCLETFCCFFSTFTRLLIESEQIWCCLWIVDHAFEHSSFHQQNWDIESNLCDDDIGSSWIKFNQSRWLLQI